MTGVRACQLRMVGVGSLALVVVALAGCGGGSAAYDAGETRACLERHGVDVLTEPGLTFNLQYVAGKGSRGGYVVAVGELHAAVAFYRDASEARASLDGLTFLAPAIYFKRNVAVSWEHVPARDEQSTVDGCLVEAKG